MYIRFSAYRTFMFPGLPNFFSVEHVQTLMEFASTSPKGCPDLFERSLVPSFQCLITLAATKLIFFCFVFIPITNSLYIFLVSLWRWILSKTWKCQIRSLESAQLELKIEFDCVPIRLGAKLGFDFRGSNGSGFSFRRIGAETWKKRIM